jgi:hypothetical protein
MQPRSYPAPQPVSYPADQATSGVRIAATAGAAAREPRAAGRPAAKRPAAFWLLTLGAAAWLRNIGADS